MISGIKCDNTQCDFEDNSVEYTEYPQWLNKPCPKCGSNLLTEEDYSLCQKMVDMTEMLGKIPGIKDIQNSLDMSLFDDVVENGFVPFDFVKNLFADMVPINPVKVNEIIDYEQKEKSKELIIKKKKTRRSK